jgi:hypothetical protein
VSTRKLIAVALLCGLAILVAGGIQLFRISDRRGHTVEVLEEGQSATVGGVQVAVVTSTHTPDDVSASIRLGPTPTAVTFGVESFTLLVGGQLERPTNADANPGDCPPLLLLGDQRVDCLLHFPPHEGTATLSFSHGGQQRLWHLDPASA